MVPTTLRRAALCGLALVLWLKSSTSTNDTAEMPDPVLTSAAAQVLLFADPHEAESSCGCGQIIRMVREAGLPGVVAVDEFDPQRESQSVPLTVVASIEGVPVGSASLLEEDMETHADLSPWLASVFVLPTSRRQGI